MSTRLKAFWKTLLFFKTVFLQKTSRRHVDGGVVSASGANCFWFNKFYISNLK